LDRLALSDLRPPPILFGRTQWSSQELTGIAVGWRDAFRGEARGDMPIATVMVNHPLAVALFFALSSFPAPIILLSPDPRNWLSSPPIPPGTPVALLPQLKRLVADAERCGLRPVVLPEPVVAAAARCDAPPFGRCSGLVAFTSGSMGVPKPVYRTTAALMRDAAARLAVLGIPKGAGIIATLPLFRSYGLTASVFCASMLGSSVALLDRFDHRAVLRLFASREYHLWEGTEAMADVLVRCSLSQPCPAPPVVTNWSVSERVFDAFRARFGVPVRNGYGLSEFGMVTFDASPAEKVRFGTAGQAIPGVEIRIGSDPRTPLPAGKAGPIWVRSPWYMEGYGFPPNLTRPEHQAGWRRTPDVGRLEESGDLVLLGRADDAVITGTGHVVNLQEVASVLLTYPGVTDAVVVPLERPSVRVIGALVETHTEVSADALRRHVAAHLPVWSHPRVVRLAAALPRFPGGKVDRLACLRLLT
jgi:acyl-CoA synthetase (AMP-forming)/AMP-acid ligase II